MYPSMTLGTLWWIPLNVGIALGQPHCNGWGEVVLESLFRVCSFPLVAQQKSFLGDHIEDLAFDNPGCEQSGFGELVGVLFFPYDCFTKVWLIIGFKDLAPF